MLTPDILQMEWLLCDMCGKAFQILEEKWLILWYDPVEYFHFISTGWASLVAQMVKNPPAMQETQVQSLGQEDALEKETATHSSILAWRMGTVHGVHTVGQDQATYRFHQIHCLVFPFQASIDNQILKYIFQMWAITWLSVVLWEIDFHWFETFREK